MLIIKDREKGFIGGHLDVIRIKDLAGLIKESKTWFKKGDKSR